MTPAVRNVVLGHHGLRYTLQAAQRLDSYDSVTMLDNGSTSRVTVGASASLSAADAADIIQGTGAVKVTGPAINQTIGIDSTNVGTFTPADMGTVAIFFKRLTEGNISSVQMALHQGGSTNTLTFSNESKFLPGGRWIAAHVSEFATFAAAGSGTIRLRALINPSTPYSAIGVFDAAYCKAKGRPTLVITLDDGYQDQYDTIVPAMLARGLKGATYWAPSLLDGTGSGDSKHATTGMLGWIYSQGFDCGCDGTMDDTVLDDVTKLQAVRTWNASNIGPRGNDFFCWPGGTINDTVAVAALAAGFKMGRTVEPQSFFTRFGIAVGHQKSYPSFGFTNSPTPTTYAAAKAFIDELLLRGSTGSMHIHYSADTGGAIAIPRTAVLYPLLDYVKSLVDANLLDVLTMSQLWARDSLATVG